MSNTDRTDQYPEVGGDDTGLVPQIKAEWPKKIRTLTATELDRLTIDGDGRFYWDGHLVNYVGPKAPEVRSPEARDASAMDILDRAAMELTGKTPPAAEASAEQPRDFDADLAAALAVSQQAAAESPAVDVAPSEPAPMPASSPVVMAAAPNYPMLVAPAVQAPDNIRVSLSVWQSIGAILVVVSFLVAAAGLAAQGWVAANEWGCRIGAVKSCPPPTPAPKAPTRPDIPE